MSVTLLTKAARDALMRRDMEAFREQGTILSKDSDGPIYEQTLDLKVGSYFIVVRNNLDRRTEVRLECFDQGKGSANQ